MASNELYCTNCDRKFEKPKGRPRCPQCLRTHGLEIVADAAPSTRRRNRLPLFVGVAAVLVAGVVAAFYFLSGTVGPGTGMTDEQILSALRAAGVTPDMQVVPFARSATVRTFAGPAITAAGDDATKAMALLGAFDTRRAARTLTVASPYRPVLRAPERSDALATGLSGGSLSSLYSYELAALFFASCREAGIDAQLAETFALPARTSPDPSGARGYYVVVVGGAAGTFFDPATGTAGAVATATLRLLDDVQAVAPFFVLRALNLLDLHGDTPGAHRLLQGAAKLDPPGPRGGPSPSLLHARAMTFLRGGGALEAIGEFERALSLRADAVRHVALAEALLLLADQLPENLDRSRALSRSAVGLDPTLARVHALEASLAIIEDDVDRARASAALAATNGLDGPALALLDAQVEHSSGNVEQAITILRAELELGPNDEVAFALIQILLQADRPAEAKAVATALLETSRRPDAVRTLLADLLEAPIPSSAGAALSPALRPDPGGPGLLGGAAAGGSPGLLGGDSPLRRGMRGAGRPSLLGGDRLKLGTPGLMGGSETPPAGDE